MHIHANNLGMPGNVATTLESFKALEGRRAHFTHLQFHAYGTGGGWKSAARELSDWVNTHPELSVDVGQVMFGPATTVTADGPVEYLLYKSSGRKWVNIDVELETGCGIVPLEYKEKAAVSALQWSIGLELFLLAKDPWRVVLSTDHPNGGSFLAYPQLIQLLMDRTVRDERLKLVNQKFLAGSALLDGLDRQFTLGEIAIITRAGPARLLGLRHKGHLGAGADADVTVYSRQDDIAAMFASPRYVLKQGELVVEEGHLRLAPNGRRLYVRPAIRRCGRSRRPLPTSTGTPPCSSTTIPCRGCRTGRSASTDMKIRGVHIEDTFAEAFTMRSARLVITARSDRWVREAALKLTGFATSVIGCKCEAGIERATDRGRDPRRPARRERAPHGHGEGRTVQAPGRAGRSDDPHLPHHRVLRRPARCARPREGRRPRSATSATGTSRAR